MRIVLCVLLDVHEVDIAGLTRRLAGLDLLLRHCWTRADVRERARMRSLLGESEQQQAQLS